MDRTRNIILSVVISSQNTHTHTHILYALTEKWILAQNLGFPKIKSTDPKNLK